MKNKNFVYLRNYSNAHVYHKKSSIVFIIIVFADMLFIGTQLASEFQIILCKYSELSSIYLFDCCISLFHMIFQSGDQSLSAAF